MRNFKNYFLLFLFSTLLASCGGDTKTSNADTRGLLAPLTTHYSASIVLNTAQTYDLIRLTLAMYNAAPGSINLGYLGGYLESGLSMSDLANLMAQTDSFKNPLLYPLSLSSQQFATKFIDNLIGTTANYLNKASLAEAITYYLDHGLSRGDAVWIVASALAKVPSTDPNWGKAATQFANRVDVAYYYSVTKSLSANDLGTLQAVVMAVTDDPATVTAAKNKAPVNLPPSWTPLSITSGNRQITIGWTAATKVSGTLTYNLYWSTKPGVTKATGNKITKVTSPYIHTGLASGTMYYYVVTTVANGIEGAESQEVATSPQALLPTAPTGTVVTPLNAAVQIAIDRTGEQTGTKYNLYWSTTSSLANAAKIANAFGSGTLFNHTPLKNGTMYYYAVTAETSEGEGARGKTIATTPLTDISATNYQKDVSPALIAAPKTVTAVTTSQQVTLTWDMPVSQIPIIFDPKATPVQTPVISAYNIYWSTNLITDTTIADKWIIPADATTKLPITFVHTGLLNNQAYYYTITAVAAKDANGNPLQNADGEFLVFESPFSSQFLVVPEVKAPVSPTGLSATSESQQITLAWTASTTKGVAYRLYGSQNTPTKPDDLVNSGNLIAITSTNAYIHTGLQYGATYYYAVTAVAEGESTPTAIVVVTLL